MLPRVLVVDDEPGVRESLRRLLRDDCEIVLTGSVGEALRALRSHPPDLVLLDLGLPDRSGFELLAELSANQDPPPVVVLSGTNTVNTAVEAMKRGAADYVTKPFEVEALRIKVGKLLEHRRLEHEVVTLRARLEPEQCVADLPPAVVRVSQIEELRRAVGRGEIGLEEASAQFETDLLREALEATGGNQSRAARRLGLTRSAFKLKIDRYGIKLDG